MKINYKSSHFLSGSKHCSLKTVVIISSNTFLHKTCLYELFLAVLPKYFIFLIPYSRQNSINDNYIFH